jgi:hypothetical protein
MLIEQGPTPEVEYANRVWAEYQRTHDLSAHDAESVVVDVVTGEVLFGPSGYQISRQIHHPGHLISIVVVRMNSADHRFLDRIKRGRPRRLPLSPGPVLPGSAAVPAVPSSAGGGLSPDS